MYRLSSSDNNRVLTNTKHPVVYGACRDLVEGWYPRRNDSIESLVSRSLTWKKGGNRDTTRDRRFSRSLLLLLLSSPSNLQGKEHCITMVHLVFIDLSVRCLFFPLSLRLFPTTKTETRTKQEIRWEHLHYEGIHRHQPDEKQLTTSDRPLDIRWSISLPHQNPEERKNDTLINPVFLASLFAYEWHIVHRVDNDTVVFRGILRDTS